MSAERSAKVIVASNRAAAGVYADRTGPLIAQWLAERGYAVEGPVVVPDGEQVEQELRAGVDAGTAVIVTSGGTGVTPTDRTPEMTARVLDYEIPGLADALRRSGLPHVPTSVLSRGRVGVAGDTLVVNLPGSRGGVSDGLDVLDGVLEHALAQLAGSDHADSGGEYAGWGGPHAGSGGPHAGSGGPHAGSGGPHAGSGGPHAGSGGPRVVRSTVTEESITADEHGAAVAEAASGAVVTFSGVVRDHDGGRQVRSLHYEGHPSAADVLDAVAAEVAARHDGLRALAVSHRIGDLAIGDVALACGVAAAHRGEAFAACADLVNTVKQRLPIWKHQVFADGTDEWVNSP